MSSYPYFSDPSGVWGAQAANPYAYNSTAPQPARFSSVSGTDSFSRNDSAKRNAAYANNAGYSGMPYFPGGAYGFNPLMMGGMYGMGMMGYPDYSATSMGVSSGSSSDQQSTTFR